MKKIICALLILGLFGFIFAPSVAKAAVCTTSGTTTVTLSGKSCTLPATTCLVAGVSKLCYGNDIAASATDLVNTGELVIAAGSSITLGASDVLVLSGTTTISGSITKVAGAQFKKGLLWVTDGDGDRYGVASSLEFSATRPGTKVRKGYMNGNDVNDAYACPAGQTMGCQYCSSGAPANVGYNTDPYNGCDTANIACANGCVVTRRTGMCNGSGGCLTAGANVAAGQLCTGAGTITTGQCQSGYTCNGLGHCCYTDIYGEHCAW